MNSRETKLFIVELGRSPYFFLSIDSVVEIDQMHCSGEKEF